MSEYGERTPTYAGRTAGCVTMLIGDSLHLSCREADIRADERRRVAEEIAELRGSPPTSQWGRGWSDAITAATHVARAHTTEGSTDG